MPVLFMSADILHNLNTTIMKEILILFCVLLYAPFVEAGWFESKPDPNLQKLERVEAQLWSQKTKTEDATLIACVLGVGCLLFLVIGTALGSKTRNHYKHETSRRMGSTSPSNLNGRKSSHLGKTPEDASHSTLAA